jgi:hypothetical protein
MNPRIAGSPGLALASTGDQFQGLMEYGAQEANLLKKAQDEGILLSAENQIGADMQAANANLERWTDYTKADQMKQDTADAIREKYAEKYGNRPDLWRTIEPYLGKELNSFNALVDRRSTVLTTEFNKGALYDSQLNAENDAATEPTLDGKERIWSIQDAKTDAMVRNGTMRADEAEVTKKMLRSRTISAEVERAANPLNSPEIMQAEIGRLKEYEGKGYVEAKELAEMQAHMGEAYKVATNRFDKVDVAKQVDATLATYKNDPTLKDPETGQFDYMKAAQKVDEDSNIPTKVKKDVREEFEQRDGVQKRVKAESDLKTLDHLDPQVENGQLTFQGISQRMLLTPQDQNYIPRTVGDHLLTRAATIQRENRTVNMQERMADRQEQAITSAQVLREAENTPGYYQHESELYQGDLSKLSNADRKTLWSSKNINGAKELRDAYELMNSSPTYPNTPEGNAQLAKDKETLRETVANKKLMGKQVIDEAQGMMAPKIAAQKASWVKGALDNIWNVGTKFSNAERSVFGLSPYVSADQRQSLENQRQSSDPGGTPLPKVGDVVQGYRFKGGDPSDQNSWEKQ